MSSKYREFLEEWTKFAHDRAYQLLREQAILEGHLADEFTANRLQAEAARLVESLEKDFIPWYAPAGSTRYKINILKKREFTDPESIYKIRINGVFLDDLK